MPSKPQAVRKYSLQIVGFQHVEIPRGARPLSVLVQHGRPVLYCLVDDPDLALGTTIPARVYIYGTGHRIETTRHHYVGSFPLDVGALVFHVFNEAPVIE
jgi:hypothetical protein